MWASTLCPLLSSTRNIALGRGSTTRPSTSMAPSFLAISSAFRDCGRAGARSAEDRVVRGACREDPDLPPAATAGKRSQQKTVGVHQAPSLPTEGRRDKNARFPGPRDRKHEHLACREADDRRDGPVGDRE